MTDLDEALLQAAQWADESKVRRCIDAGADVNTRDRRGWTPLHRAAINAGADGINVIGGGVNDDAVKVARLLVAAGAQLNAENEDGNTPESLASSWRKTAMAELLQAIAQRQLAAATPGVQEPEAKPPRRRRGI